MTKREILLKAQEIENEIAKLNGNEVKALEPDHIYLESRGYKIHELQERIESAERRLAQAKRTKAEAEWLATDEGKSYTERLEQAKENLRNGHDASEKKAISELNSLIKLQLGNKWGLCNFDDSQMRIGIVDTEKDVKEDGTYKSLFGHDFTVYDDHKWGENRFEINYGCMGSFDPIKDASRACFLVGLARLASDTNLQEEVKRIHREFTATVAELRKEYEAMKNENPFKA